MKTLLLLTALFIASINYTYAQWTQLVSGSTSDFYDVHIVNDSVGFVAGANQILKTIDQGDTWVLHIPSNASDSAKFLNTTFYGIYFVDGQVGYACGNHAPSLNRIIFKTTDGG
ncbi:MAG: hypothetical protein JKX73_03765, partial [Flavobacteriales bacterium]|nr:hypothetical protein [Flavobacteriales bacterium]